MEPETTIPTAVTNLPGEVAVQTTNNPMSVFDGVKTQIIALADKCDNFIITSDESLSDAESLAKDAKKIEKAIEEKRVEITKPILDRKKEIDDFAKNLIVDLTAGIKSLRERILKYKQEQEAKRAEELKRLEEERKRKEEELKQQMQADQPIDQKDIQELQEIKQQQAQTISAPASKGISKVWTYDIIDENAIPREFLCPDEKKIKEAVKNGVREIPGVIISQKNQLTLR